VKCNFAKKWKYLSRNLPTYKLNMPTGISHILIEHLQLANKTCYHVSYGCPTRCPLGYIDRPAATFVNYIYIYIYI